MGRTKNSLNAKTKKTKTHEPQLSPHSTEAAFDTIKSDLDALARTEIRQPNFNLQEGALVALAAHSLLDTPETRVIVEALAKAGTVNLKLVADLAMVAHASWFVRHKLDLADAVHSDAALPMQLVTDAIDTRKRMLKVLDYHLDADAQAQSLLAGTVCTRLGQKFGQRLCCRVLAMGREYMVMKIQLRIAAVVVFSAIGAESGAFASTHGANLVENLDDQTIEQC